MLPQVSDNDYLSELQFALAYSQLTLPLSSEDMLPAELLWWHKRLMDQRKAEEETREKGPEGGLRQSAKNMIETLASRAGFGFLRGKKASDG